MIVPQIIGDDHINPKSVHHAPFAVGDLDPDKPFIHVLDDVTLDIILRERDTITDFTLYLRKKEIFIRSGHLEWADGEENLLTYFSLHIGADGRHDFVRHTGGQWKPSESLAIRSGLYQAFITGDQYRAKKASEVPSYFWDFIIQTITTNILASTTTPVLGFKVTNLQQQEESVRHMALVPRFLRGYCASIIFDVLGPTVGGDGIKAQPACFKGNETGFVFMTVSKPADWEHDRYLAWRLHLLVGYSSNVLKACPWLERIVAIAYDPLPNSVAEQLKAYPYLTPFTATVPLVGTIVTVKMPEGGPVEIHEDEEILRCLGPLISLGSSFILEYPNPTSRTLKRPYNPKRAHTRRAAQPGGLTRKQRRVLASFKRKEGKLYSKMLGVNSVGIEEFWWIIRA
jgi:hypothetical protein